MTPDFEVALRLMSDLSFINSPFCDQFMLRNYHLYLGSLFERSVQLGMKCELEFFHLLGNLLVEKDFDSGCLGMLTKQVFCRLALNSADSGLVQDYVDKFLWLLYLSSNFSRFC